MNFGMSLAVGKPGKKPAFPSRELMANERGRDNHFAALIWSDDAGGSFSMHRGLTPKDISRRAFVSSHHAKCTPLFSLSRVHLSRHPHNRCLEGALVCRCDQRGKFIWYRHRYDCARHQCCPARWLYLWLSFPAAFGRGISRSVFKITKLLPRLRMRELFQSPSHALGM